MIDVPWGKAVDPGQVADRLTAETRAVFATQSETSTGVLHDIEAIAQIVRKTDALMVVDGVSSVGQSMRFLIWPRSARWSKPSKPH